MTIYCVFREVSMNVFQVQYVLIAAFKTEDRAIELVSKRKDLHYEIFDLE